MFDRISCLAAALAFACATAAAAEAFPPITEQDRTLTAVPGQPNAPAVVLFRKGELHMMNPASQDVSSYLRVEVRLKILTAAGKDRGDVKIAHSGFFRLQGIEGRTVLPDGTVVPLPKDVQFRRTTSRSRRVYVTSVAFPAVEVGAILDYHYTVKWDSIFFLDPWFFQDRIPVLHSEIVYDVPVTLQAAAWKSDPMHVGLKSETLKGQEGTRLRAWADDLPAVPEERDSLPFSDMAAQEMMLPTAYVTRNVVQRLFESWAATCKVFDDEYEAARRKDGDSAQRARQLAAAAPPATSGAGASRQRREAAAIYRFVRDEVATEEANRVWLPRFSTAGAVFDNRKGEPAEKALLLQVMLAAIGIDARLVWAADREDGSIDMQVPNPAWFDRVLVAAQIDGQRVFLDPEDRALSFGHLQPGYEGTNALLYDARKPEIITLPETPFDQNVRRARLELTVDAAGRAAGRGTLTLLGQPAWQKTGWTGGRGTAEDAWKDWLGKQFPGYDVGGVGLSEGLDEPRVEVSWTLAQHAEDALGDQEALVPSRPVGPVRQPFPAGAKRLSAVTLAFAERSEVDLVVHWAEGWQPDAVPRAARVQTAAGEVVATVTMDAAARTLTYQRRFDIAHRKAATAEQFHLVQALFEEAQKSDAQPLVLSRR
jgi:transglutaminase-like putative cysteine protease